MSVTYKIDERGVAFITIDRADKHNAFDDKVIQELLAAFQDSDKNETVNAIVLQSQGKHFSAGADLAWMQGMADYSFDENVEDAQQLANMLLSLDRLSKPTVARVQGAAFGGAVGLVSCCDIAVATDNASFCLSEVKLGLVPATISPFVVAAIGSRAARRYFQTAETFDAETALRLKLVSHVVEQDQLDQKVNEVIDMLLVNGSEAMSESKRLIFELDQRPVDDALINHTCEVIARARVSDEGQQRLKRFLNQRANKKQSHKS